MYLKVIAMKNFACVFFAPLFLLFSCSDNHVSRPEEATLSQDVKTNARELVVETIGLAESLFRAKEFDVYHDSILIVTNKAGDGTPFLEFYRLNSQERVRGFFRKGNGPSEMLDVHTVIHNGKVVVHDYIKNTYCQVDIDSAVNVAGYAPQPLKDLPKGAMTASLTAFSDDSLLLWNPYYFVDERQNISNNVTKPFEFLKKGETPENFWGNHEYFTFNVSQGLIFTNPEADRIICASYFLPEIGIYSTDGTLIKKINGPDKLPYDIAAINNNVAFKDKIPYAYKSFCIDGDAFYISYVGDYMVNGDETKDFGSYIFKFDFDGNLLESYHSPVYIGRLSKISGKDTFYCRSIDKQGSTVLCRLK